ncbi:MAG: hypothetical protein JO250_09285 [Armatimonadetes bacterium]|nr:hypothetical protein [Armatimonadota bacterium]
MARHDTVPPATAARAYERAGLAPTVGTRYDSQPASAPSSPFRTFAPDGAGGWREVTTEGERRALARRILLASYGLSDLEQT